MGSARLSTPTKLPDFADASRTGSPAFYTTSRSGSPALYGGRIPQPRSHNGSPLAKASVAHLGISKVSSTSNLLSSPNDSPSSRSPRITRETVQRKLGQERSFDSPSRNALEGDYSPSTTAAPQSRRLLEDSAQDKPEQKTTPSTRPAPKRVPPPKLTNENSAYDGVEFLAAEHHPIEIPTPSVPIRAASFDHVAGPPPALASEKLSRASLPPTFDNGGGERRGSAGGGSTMANLNDMRSALDRLMADVAGEATLAPDGKGVIGLKVEAVTEGIKAGKFTVPTPIEGAEEDDSRMEGEGEEPVDDTREDTELMDVEHMHDHSSASVSPSRRPESLLQAAFLSPESTGSHARPTSPQPGTGNAIRAREELIKAMKARKREEEEAMQAETSIEYYTPPRRAPSTRRPNRRRSRSTGDAEILGERRTVVRARAETMSGGGLLDVVPIEDEEEDPLADSIDRELRRRRGEHTVSPFSSVLWI